MRDAVLVAIIKKLNPALSQKDDGSWPGGKAPYEIRTARDNSKKVLVTSEDGDVLAGVGKTLDEALAHLCKKIGLTVPGAAAQEA